MDKLICLTVSLLMDIQVVSSLLLWQAMILQIYVTHFMSMLKDKLL